MRRQITLKILRQKADPHACRTHAPNFPDVPLFRGDIERFLIGDLAGTPTREELVGAGMGTASASPSGSSDAPGDDRAVTAMMAQQSRGRPMRLKEKVAIVTGGALGMGEAEARLFATEGAKVIVADILASEAERVAAGIRADGGEATAAKIDVTSEAEWVALIAKAVTIYDRLDILVNNAGISGSSVGDPDGLAGWDRIIAVNQTSVFLGTKLAAEQMAKSGGGSIVNISSIMGFVGSTSGHPAYHASKGAVRIYSKAAAVRYGPSGVRINTVHPGYMPPMLNATNAGERDDKIAATPLRRIGKPIEVAYGVLFLASDEASFITGTELVIDGGFIAQ
jgi:NAD(P)-dependent dehydrogenase (short-subunit alcohol dehydrogenase family)